MSLISLTNQQLAVSLQYPDPTPLGSSVSINEKVTAVSYRIHLISDASNEVYFEVGYYPTLSLAEAMTHFKQELVAQTQEVVIGEAVDIMFGAYAGCRFSVRWPEKKRVITFFVRDGATYRVIYNPASPLNGQILATLAFMDVGA